MQSERQIESIVIARTNVVMTDSSMMKTMYLNETFVLIIPDRKQKGRIK